MFKNNVYVFVFFTCFWFILVIASGSLFSGYKFMDDSGHLVLTAELNNGKPAFRLISDYVKADLETRFRPLWSAEYAARTVVLKDNFILHSIYRALEVVFICFFLFLFSRKTGLSQRISVLFALLTTVGQQSVIAWALAPSEGIGMLFLSLALLFMAKSVMDNERKPVNELLFVLFTVLMSLSKESFIFFVPALYVWRLWLYSRIYNLSFFQGIGKNLFIGILLGGIVLSELYTLINISTSFGYAGTDTKLGIFSYLKTFNFLLIFSITGLVSLIGLILIFLKIPFRINKWIYPFLLFAAIVFPQIIIYAKSGILERYFLPGVLGFVMLVIYQLTILEKDPVNYRVNKGVAMLLSLFSTAVLSGGLMLALSYPLRVSIIKIMLSFKGDVVQAMNPLSIVVIRSSANIQVIAVGIACIGLLMVAGCVCLIRFKIKTFRLYHAFMVVVLIGLAINLVSTFGWAKKFAKESEIVNSFLSAIITNTQTNDAVLVVADPWVHLEAANLALPVYLKLKGNRNNLHGFPVFINSQAATVGNKQLFLETYGNFTPQPFSCIAMFPETEQLFLNEVSPWLNTSKYSRIELQNGYVVYTRKTN